MTARTRVMRASQGAARCVIALALAACEANIERMLDQDRFDPYEAAPMFADGTIMRHPPPATVPRERQLASPDVADGVQGGQYVERVPIEVSAQRLARGRDRYDIFCAPCHGVLGDGDTMVASSMPLRPPPSLHEPRIRAFPAGRIYQAVGQGYGLMPSYSAQLSVEDRWAVTAYVQALQLSQHVRVEDLPAELRQEAEAWLR